VFLCCCLRDSERRACAFLVVDEWLSAATDEMRTRPSANAPGAVVRRIVVGRSEEEGLGVRCCYVKCGCVIDELDVRVYTRSVQM
jgi:hypothetical protein